MGRLAGDLPLVAELADGPLRAGDRFGQMGLEAPLVAKKAKLASELPMWQIEHPTVVNFENLKALSVQRVHLVECVLLQSATKLHERGHFAAQLGKANMGYFFQSKARLSEQSEI